MNVYFQEMRATRKSLIIWSVGMVLLLASSMGKYAGLTASGQSVNDLMGQMPKSLQALWGVGTFDLSTAGGYYGLLFIYLAVMATIHAAMLGANIISKEERDKTAEFLFVKPASRNSIITQKLSASLTNIIIFNVVTLVSSILLVKQYSNGEDVTGDIVTLMIGLFMLQLIFMFIGTAIAAVSKKPKTAASLSTGILLITFILSIVIEINSALEGLKYLTPFKYFEAKNLLMGAGFEAVYIALSVIIIGGLCAITYTAYKKRDLNV